MLQSYTDFVEPKRSIEGDRGVDLSQIRRQLAMSVPQRVDEMVHAANVLIAIQDRSRVVPGADD